LATVVEALDQALARAPKVVPAGALRATYPNGTFSRANSVDTRLVLDHCGIEFDEKFARCPGCGEPKALICENGGIKCLHARCADVGPVNFPGFRSNVDIVAQREGIAPSLAAEQILRWFGPDNAVRSLARPGEDSAGPAWKRPLPLHDRQGGAPFPVHALGTSLREWVEAEAGATQTPPDLAAVVALATLSACVSKKFEVEIRPGWREPLNTYWLVALDPGNRKSAVFRDAVRPIQDFERQLTEKLRDVVQAALVKREIKQRELKRAIDVAARSGLPTDRQLAAELAIEFERERVPVIPRLVVDDVTPERLAAMLAEQGGRLALLSAEGGLFEVAGGRYSDGVPNLDVLLKSHPGDDLRVDRVGRGPVHVRHPALTLGVAVQPEVIRELARKPVFRGSGLLARIFYSLPESTVGRRDACPPPVAALVSERYHQLCTALLRIDEARVDGELTPAPLNFSSEACRRIEQFSRELEPRLGPGCELSPICDWANKLAGGIARVAAVLHLAEGASYCGHSGNCGNPDRTTAEDLGEHSGYSGNCGREHKDQIEVEAVDRAILIGRYLLAHAQAAFALMGTDPEIENARQLLSWLRSFKISRFTKRDAWQATRGRFKKASELDPPLSLLVEHGYLAEDPQPDRPGQGRRPSPAFTVNPYTHNSQNTHNG
jgi:hypothetical protein